MTENITVTLKYVFTTTYPMSRSEARELFPSITLGNIVTLDFTGIEDVGPSFVHELFVVWQRNNPDIKLNVINACDNVDFMIRRVINIK